MSKKKDKEFYDYVDSVENYKVLGTYTRKIDDITMYHEVCGKTYKQKPANFMKGARCHHCSPSRPWTTDDVVNALNEKYGEKYTLLSEYKNSITPLWVRDNDCNHEYKVKRQDILAGARCFKCHGSKKYTQKEFEEIFNKRKLNGYSLIGTYKGINADVKIKHDICGTVFVIQPARYFNQGKNCPTCKPKSIGELKVKNILKNHNIKYYEQYTYPDCVDKKVLFFDFYLPEYNILIEYQGLQHYEPVGEFGGQEVFKDVIRRDNIKREYSKANNIKLIEIPYWIKNIEDFLVEKIC